MFYLCSIILMSLILAILSLFINDSGGLYIHSYLENSDLYKISDLQGSGESDHVLIIIASVFLLVANSISSIFFLVNRKLSILFMLFSMIISFCILMFMETASFIDIAFSTVYKGNNLAFSLWLILYISLFLMLLFPFKSKNFIFCKLKINDFEKSAGIDNE